MSCPINNVAFVLPLAIRINLRAWQQVACNHAQIGGALHSAFSGLSAVGAARPFAGVAFNKMRRPGTRHTLKRWVKKRRQAVLHAEGAAAVYAFGSVSR